LLTLVLEMVVVIFPIVMKVEREKNRMYMVLLEVPTIVAKRMVQLTQRGFERCRNELNSDTTGADPDEEHEDDYEVGARPMCARVCVARCGGGATPLVSRNCERVWV
jgi:hypothetical protein